MYCKNCGTMLNDTRNFVQTAALRQAAAEDSARTAEESSCPALTFVRSAALP